MLTALAAWLRLAGLNAPDGRLDTDEARLALSADGVLRSGVPVLPSGRVYTRGLLNSYLMAPSFVLLGRHDFAARLPSALAGLLLVPLVFLLGRLLGGPAAGLAAASFTALAEPLVQWSRSAWLPSIFLLLFTAAAYAGYRGFVGRRGDWQVIAAVVFLLALLSYEFALLLLGGLGGYLTLEALRGRRDWLLGRSTLAALGLLTGGLALFGALALALRVGTLAGPLGEVSLYFSPGLRPSGPAFYWRALLAEYWPLVLAALVGLPLLARARPRGTVYLGGLLTLAFLAPSFVIQAKQEQHYGLSILPLLASLAAAGTVRMAGWLGERGGGRDRLLPWVALLLVFGSALVGDLGAAVRRLAQPPPGPTWLQALEQQGVGPGGDSAGGGRALLLAEAPTIVQFYLGRDDFYLHPEGYERYTYQSVDAIRSIYTNSVLLRERGDFERLVETPHPGRMLWVVGREERLLRLAQQVDPRLWPSLVGSASGGPLQTRDRWVLLRLTLPRR